MSERAYARCGRRDTETASSAGDGEAGATFTYGTGEEDETAAPTDRDATLLRHLSPGDADLLEKEERDKREDRNRRRMPMDEARKRGLVVEKVNALIKANAKEHHTDRYHCVKAEAKKRRPVLRRGQTFQLILTFNQPDALRKGDVFFKFEADSERPANGLMARFQLDEERWQMFDAEGQEWGARKIKAEGFDVHVEIFIPGNCVVGEWIMTIITTCTRPDGKVDKLETKYGKTICILFNPWSKGCQTFYTEDPAHLEEYVLNEHGAVFVGNCISMQSFGWNYSQFEEGILQTALSLLRRAFRFRKSAKMANPLEVSRALSAVVNSQDDDGVLVGNWSGDYKGGKKPTEWTNSRDILKSYAETGCPVKYGQCWVFSHVLTAVCRALGLPCRSVTNFSSAHDTDNTCTIDKYYDENGKELKYMGSDSIWNFHVWNEAWVLRRDIFPNTGVYDGWHCIDATPQEQSNGKFQCGPCPVAAVKKGEIQIGYDTPFVFSEVNAEVARWSVTASGELELSSLDTAEVGARISTKFPDGKPVKKGDHLRPWRDNPKVRKDITNDYKFGEGSPAEREAARRAVCHTRGDIYKKGSELKVNVQQVGTPTAGEDLVIEATVKNVSKEDKLFSFIMSTRSIKYWDQSEDLPLLQSVKVLRTNLAPGQEYKKTLTTKAKDYIIKGREISPSTAFYGYACARVINTNMPYSCETKCSFELPDLQIDGPEQYRPGEVVLLTVTMPNPLPVKLTGVHFEFNDMTLANPDDERFRCIYGSYRHELGDVEPGKAATVAVKVKADVKQGKELQGFFAFDCDQLSFVHGYYEPEIVGAPPAESESEDEAEPTVA